MSADFSSELKRKDERIAALEKLLSTREEELARLQRDTEGAIRDSDHKAESRVQEALRLMEESQREKSAGMEAQLNSLQRDYTQKAEELDRCVAELMRTHDDNNQLRKEVEYEIHKGEEQAKRGFEDLVGELNYYKKKCEEQTVELEETGARTAARNEEQIEQYKRRVGEQNELRIRELLSQNGFLKIQVERLQDEVKALASKLSRAREASPRAPAEDAIVALVFDSNRIKIGIHQGEDAKARESAPRPGNRQPAS